MWEALRQQSLSNLVAKLVNNAISIQAAIWEEAFWNQEALSYQKQEYNILGIPVNGTVTDTYSEDRLINNSWAFWFNQGDNGLYAAKNAVSTAINSYANGDEYLNGSFLFSMKRNDFYSTKDYYYRTSDTHRTPNSLPDKAAMFRQGEIVRKGVLIPLEAFTDPLGATKNNYFNNNNINAVNLGWRSNKHSDFQELPFYEIIEWYKAAFPFAK
jgi:hypothetical protein